MNKEREKLNKYLSVNAVRRSAISSFPEKKREVLVKVSDKELAEKVFYWDPSVRQFIRVGR